MKISKIIELLKANPFHYEIDSEIKWLLTDSRSLMFPDQSLFFAIRTDRNDGHKYIPELYQSGLRNFVISTFHPEFNQLTDAVFFKVENTVDALQLIVSAHRKAFNIPVLGITGSNGKTIVKEWLYQLLHADFNITRSPRSYNSQIGVPLSVWSLNENSQLGIFEAGISMPGEMNRLEKIIRPEIGIFTNLGDAHQENFVSLKHKCEEKLQLFRNSKVLIYNADNKLVDIAISKMYPDISTFTWGFSNNAKLKVISKIVGSASTSIQIQHNETSFEIFLPFTDDASFENVMHCIAYMLFSGFLPEVLNERISRLEPVAMRLELKQGVQNCLIINDSYNSDINSLHIALDFLNRQAAVKNLKRTLILSDILQSGQAVTDLYNSVAQLLHSKPVERIIGIGTEISSNAALFSKIKSSFYENTEVFLRNISSIDFQNEAILLKGSRSFHFEDISSVLELLSHETTLEVNLNNLVDNLNVFRNHLLPTTKVMGMVKAFAYGSGSVEVARTLQHNRCDYLAVAVADEGAELRREGIRIPIVVMNPEKGSFNVIFEHKLEPEIYSFRLLHSFIKAASSNGITDFPVHIKIDTGMHRLGFEPAEIDELIALLKNQQQVKVRSVFSHLAGADASELDYFTHYQAAIFEDCSRKITQAISYPVLKHLLNSAGSGRFPDYQYNMVRLGIGLYGVSAHPDIKLKQVCTLKTVVLQIKHLTAGETVGYNRNGVLSKDTTIAVLPVGYADGFDRHLGNGRGEVFVHGKRVRTVGNVSMDLITVDVTGIDVKEGDTVEIFGNNITISEIAEKLDTIPYEILTGVSRRVKRIYFQE